MLPTPNPANSFENELLGVTCSAGGVCEAVGETLRHYPDGGNVGRVPYRAVQLGRRSRALASPPRDEVARRFLERPLGCGACTRAPVNEVFDPLEVLGPEVLGATDVVVFPEAWRAHTGESFLDGLAATG